MTWSDFGVLRTAQTQAQILAPFRMWDRYLFHGHQQIKFFAGTSDSRTFFGEKRSLSDFLSTVVSNAFGRTFLFLIL